MPSPRLVVEVLGLPAPQGSKRHVGNGVMVESGAAKLLPWRQDVKFAAVAALTANPEWDPATRAVAMHVVFTLPRPRSHYRTGKYAALLRDDAPALHATKPDLDKLLRSTGDALTTAGAYADDSRLAQVYARKCYVTNAPGITGALDKPGARIVLTEVGNRYRVARR